MSEKRVLATTISHDNKSQIQRNEDSMVGLDDDPGNRHGPNASHEARK